GRIERRRIEELLAARFGLEGDVVQELLDHAGERIAEGSDWHGYTRVLKDAYGEAGRIAIVEMLWEVVLADGVVHDYEASLMRRVPALLYVSDRENADARSRAAERLAQPGSRGGPWG
ncbi:MAG TPA: TerB family tellurite resistance protein, partial [Myxococcota bacterium]|nr:TerB family tellurite resistance protein [Myxococcota bacterium]